VVLGTEEAYKWLRTSVRLEIIMTAKIFICHTESSTQWVDQLVEFLETASTNPALIRCSYLPGYASSSEESDCDDLREAIFQSDVVVAITSADALLDPEYMFELGAAWAFDRWIIPVMIPGTGSEGFPKPIRDLPSLTADGTESIIQLAQHVSVGYVESQQTQAALQRMFETDEQESEDAAQPKAATPQELEQNQSESLSEQQTSTQDTTTDSTPQALAEESPAIGEEPAPAEESPPIGEEPAPPQEESAVETHDKTELPSALESFNAGIAFADCMFNREGTSSFSTELDEPLGGFIDALGGDWKNLRNLDDLDVFNGVAENLIASLPPEKSAISYWYDIGLRISTLLNIAGRGLPTDPQERESTESEWNGGITSFRFLASQVEMQEQDIAEVQAMLENLIGPESEKDYSNMSKCLERLRGHAATADQKPANP